MKKNLIMLVTLLLSFNSFAGKENFTKGPVFKNYGENVAIKGALIHPEKQTFKVVFDIANINENGGVNGNFNTVARFINMHVRAGVPLENIDVAMVVHGKAGFDLMTNAAYKNKFDQDNVSAELVSLLLAADVKIYLCGQSASYLGVDKVDLIPSVEMALSAMTANALLQQQRYTLNPF
ncbi:DsrE family protein [Thalassotalea nanhaiensis]|uniref:DsrE family protein n=1 Tax=Thalassotalea nanhaiensis TaxID=3065648 RepID=A0ABY9TKL2_9GAMM|nr:DsrE family protein [Colwelliaceae bacterium SQ345]